VAVALIVATLLFVSLLLLLWRGQEHILFQPPRLREAPEPADQVAYTAADGQQLAGYLLGDPRRSTGVLICFHGNADLSMWQLDWGRSVVARTGYSVMLAEYRGYMDLDGRPTYASTRFDALAALDFIRSIAPPSTSLAYFGHSLGSGIATELAETHPPSSLLLQSPFTSARDMARLIVSRPVEMLWRRVSRIHFDTREIVGTLQVPVWVAHGTEDRIVPFRMGLEVFEASAVKGELLVVDGAGHNDVERKGGPTYWQWLTDALLKPAG
jgi:uncharacterized protein